MNRRLLILGVILVFAEYFSYKLKDTLPFMSLSIVGSFLLVSFFVEETPVAAFSIIRDTFLLFLIYYLIKSVMKLIFVFK